MRHYEHYYSSVEREKRELERGQLKLQKWLEAEVGQEEAARVTGTGPADHLDI